MVKKSIGSLFLVLLTISGCKCSSDSGLSDKTEKAKESTKAVAPQNLSELQLSTGQDQAPSQEQAEPQADVPMLPVESGEKRKRRKAQKKKGLPEHCKIYLEAGDDNKFSKSTIKIHKSCPKIRLTLRHVGAASREDGGRNVVIIENRNVQDFLEKALVAGAINHYTPRHDGRIVAATKLIGGKKTTRVEFSTDYFVDGVDYIYICTYPDREQTMRGKITFAP